MADDDADIRDSEARGRDLNPLLGNGAKTALAAVGPKNGQQFLLQSGMVVFSRIALQYDPVDEFAIGTVTLQIKSSAGSLLSKVNNQHKR